VKLGIVLATREDLSHALAIALAARAARHEVAMFAMDAGCNALAEHADIAHQLLDADVEITACSNSSVGIELADGIVRGSQDDHAAVVGTSDRVVALT
jgi:predicted peroxiredoxin